MKTLVIYPGSDVQKDSPFHILDPDTGECLASHFLNGFIRSSKSIKFKPNRPLLHVEYNQKVLWRYVF